jgi:RNA polymerase sigma factor (sigma-70 family)
MAYANRNQSSASTTASPTPNSRTQSGRHSAGASSKRDLFIFTTLSTPEHTAARKQIREILERAIDDLPPAFRTVLIFRDVEEASVEETANVLGIKPETVRTQLHRARRMLRDSLGEQFAAVLKDVFPFERPRCDALVRKLLIEVGLICQQQD